MTVYHDYSKARVGHFFGLSGAQFATVALSSLPVFGVIQRQAWATAAVLGVVWVLLLAIVCVPVRGRSATGWFWSTCAFTVGGLAGRTRFRSRATRGQLLTLEAADFPGILAGIEIHDGPPSGPEQRRIAIIQNHATKTWAATAAVVHPGIGMTAAEDRNRHGQAMTELINLTSRGELVDELLFVVRTVPDDGAERAAWMAGHRRSGGPEISRQVNDGLHTALSRASVRTESFVSLVVPETRLAKPAREAGGGLDGRARILQLQMAELEGQLRGGMGMSEVGWLTSPELAAACRTGFAPGDRAGLVDAANARLTDPTVNAEVPQALAGPSGADQAVRHYRHDAWHSISATILLPDKGAIMGAIQPMLTPTEPGERRSFVAAFPIESQRRADRKTATGEWSADLGEAMRAKAKVKQRARSRAAAQKARGLDIKLASGNAMSLPYAVVTVTVPHTLPIAEFGRRLDASIRRAGFAPLRLDVAQDVGFAATNVPLAVSLTRGTSL